MASEPRTIAVEPGGEIDRLLDEAAGRPLRLVRGNERYRLHRESGDPWADYDPERAIAGMRAAAGGWGDLDADALKAAVYRWREEGSRSPDRS